jgi:hypothetical protein
VGAAVALACVLSGVGLSAATDSGDHVVWAGKAEALVLAVEALLPPVRARGS